MRAHHIVEADELKIQFEQVLASSGGAGHHKRIMVKGVEQTPGVFVCVYTVSGDGKELYHGTSKVSAVGVYNTFRPE